MTDKYTPTTADVRDKYLRDEQGVTYWLTSEATAEFERWLDSERSAAFEAGRRSVQSDTPTEEAKPVKPSRRTLPGLVHLKRPYDPLLFPCARCGQLPIHWGRDDVETLDASEATCRPGTKAEYDAEEAKREAQFDLMADTMRRHGRMQGR